MDGVRRVPALPANSSRCCNPLRTISDTFRAAPSAIAAVTGIPESEVYGVITFYNQFRLRPVGTYVIRVCCGTACHVAHSRTLSEAIQGELGV